MSTLDVTKLKSKLSNTPTQFVDSDDVEVGQLCRAWVNYNGVTNTKTESFNVSSVTDNSTGNFTINFDNTLPDANYVFSGSAKYPSNDNHVLSVGEYWTGTTKTTSLLNIVVGVSGSASYVGSRVDALNISVMIFR